MRIELDTWPLGLPPSPTVIDHASLVVRRLLHRAPFRELPGPVPAAGPDVCDTADTADAGLTWRLGLSPNGPADNAALAAALNALRDDPDPAHRLARQIVRQACPASDGSVLLTLTRPVGYLTDLLASPAFWLPAEFVPGYYTVDRLDPTAGLIVLRPADPARTGEISFTVTQTPATGYGLLDEGRLDYTCHTYFDPYISASGHPGILSAAQHLLMTVSLLPVKGSELSRDASGRLAVSLALRRELLAAAAGGIMTPLWRYSAMWSSPCVTAPMPDPNLARRRMRESSLASRPTLRLDYAPFAPNAEIAREAARQIERVLDIEVVPQPIGYERYAAGNGDSGSDLELVLANPPYADPSAWLWAWSADLPRNIRRRIAQAERVPLSRHRMAAYQALEDEILRTSMPTVPLLRCQARYRRRSGAPPLPVTPLGMLHPLTVPSNTEAAATAPHEMSRL